MLSVLTNVFSRKRKTIIQDVNPRIKDLIEEIFNYYDGFKSKVALFEEIKESIIFVKSEIYDFNSDSHKNLNPENVSSLQIKVSDSVESLKRELDEIEQLLLSGGLKNSDIDSHEIIVFIDSEIEEGNTDPSNKFWEPYKESLLDIRRFLVGDGRNNFGLLNLLSSQIHLLRDIEFFEEELKSRIKKLKNKKDFDRLVGTLKILELDIMRFGRYISLEAQLLKPGKLITQKLESSMVTLRKLGLVYSETKLNKSNIKIITTKLTSAGKSFYGAKGIGVIHKDNSVGFRFVKGAKEKHAEVVQMLFKGIPGNRLSGDLAIQTYLRSLNLDTLAKIAGFELQLQFDNNDELKIVNIDYASTILEVQVDLKLSGKFVKITKRDFDRLSYALLFSINEKLVDKKAFEINIKKFGSKIKVTDKRILPLVVD